MKITSHRHFPTFERIPDEPWTGCVDTNSAHSEVAHGGVIHPRRCVCGATRLDESNGGVYIQGRWSNTGDSPKEDAL